MIYLAIVLFLIPAYAQEKAMWEDPKTHEVKTTVNLGPAIEGFINWLAHEEIRADSINSLAEETTKKLNLAMVVFSCVLEIRDPERPENYGNICLPHHVGAYRFDQKSPEELTLLAKTDLPQFRTYLTNIDPEKLLVNSITLGPTRKHDVVISATQIALDTERASQYYEIPKGKAFETFLIAQQVRNLYLWRQGGLGPETDAIAEIPQKATAVAKVAEKTVGWEHPAWLSLSNTLREYYSRAGQWKIWNPIRETWVDAAPIRAYWARVGRTVAGEAKFSPLYLKSVTKVAGLPLLLAGAAYYFTQNQLPEGITIFESAPTDVSPFAVPPAGQTYLTLSLLYVSDMVSNLSSLITHPSSKPYEFDVSWQVLCKGLEYLSPGRCREETLFNEENK